jgi:hypothetical protein
MQSLAANGASSTKVIVTAAAAGDRFLVKSWTYGAPSYANTPPYNWQLQLPTTSFTMVPTPSPAIYGGLTSLTNVPGQNTTPPSEKAFGNHRIALFAGKYYDPSYGLTYTGPMDFQTQAVDGFIHDYGDSTTNNMILRVRQPGGTNGITLTPYK